MVTAHGRLSVVCGPSCSVTRGTLVPQPGLEPKSPALEGGLLTPGPRGKSLLLHLCFTLPGSSLWVEGLLRAVIGPDVQPPDGGA